GCLCGARRLARPLRPPAGLCGGHVPARPLRPHRQWHNRGHGGEVRCASRAADAVIPPPARGRSTTLASLGEAKVVGWGSLKLAIGLDCPPPLPALRSPPTRP